MAKKRSEIENQYKWALEDLFKDQKAWESAIEQVKNMTDNLSEYQGSFENTQKLYQYLKNKDEMYILFEKIYVYANETFHGDTSLKEGQEMSQRAAKLSTWIESRLSFEEPEILKIEEEKMQQMYKEEPKLEEYKRYIDLIFRQKKYIKSQEIEEILAQTQDLAGGPSDIFSMFNNADLKFPAVKDEQGKEHALTHGNYISYLEKEDRTLRKNAFEALYSMYETYKNTLAAIFQSNVKKQWFYAKVRGYESAMQMALFYNEIPVSVYTNLVKTIQKGLPEFYEYLKLRKNLLGVQTLHMYDLYVPIVKDFEWKIDYERAKQIVLEALQPLGKDYIDKVREGFANRWIDVYENENKRTGAYSWGAYGEHPYILMNYQDNLNGVFTLAHEMGHSMHSYYSDAAQSYVNAGYKIFVAEVASTCNEILLIQYLLEKSQDKQEKIYLLNYMMDQFRGTLFRQTMFAEFEMIVHEKIQKQQPLVAENLCEIYYDLNQKYFGETVEIDPQIAMEWARIPHFYTPFYVYQYATGYSAAMAIATKILAGEEGIIENYKKFLSGGSSMDCISLLKLCGVDMTKTQPVEEALKIYQKYLEELKELTNQ